MSTSKTSKPSKTKIGRTQNTTLFQRYAILDWLEMPPGSNFQLITGQSTKGLPFVVAGVKTSKKAGFQMMADFINERTSSNWTSEDASSRFKSWEKLFKSTTRKYFSSDGKKFMLREKDFIKGITTIEEKLNSLCPLFYRMQSLFGNRQNVLP